MSFADNYSVILTWILIVMPALIYIVSRFFMVYISVFELKERKYLSDYGEIASYPFGKAEVLLIRRLPIVLRDRKGQYHRYVDCWTPCTGQYIKEYTGMSKEEFFELPFETKYAKLARHASGRTYAPGCAKIQTTRRL
ncbi:MAG: hypothetical protein J5518_04865 [Lachnospiraceae bacterium]|nr:hypothetical protein [Lachnospiraceae bacterium]